MHDAPVLTRACLFSFIGALVLLPMAALSSFPAPEKTVTVGPAAASKTEINPWHKEDLAAVPDPFLPAAYDAPSAPAGGAESSPLVGRTVRQGEATGYAVPARSAQQIFVRAIVLGDEPYALIEEGEQTQLVTVGDPLLRSTIATITSVGIRLHDGTLLRVSESQ